MLLALAIALALALGQGHNTTPNVPANVQYAMQHGYVCWLETSFHRDATVSGQEWLCKTQ